MKPLIEEGLYQVGVARVRCYQSKGNAYGMMFINSKRTVSQMLTKTSPHNGCCIQSPVSVSLSKWAALYPWQTCLL